MSAARESTRLAQPNDAPARDHDVGARIQAVRLCLGLSIPQMAELMRITPDEIEQAERGEDSASYSLVAIVVPLGALTGASADWLLFGRRDMWRPGGPFVAPQPGAAAMIDRAMVEAWESWVAARRALSALPHHAPESEEGAVYRVTDVAEAVITWTPAATAMARAIKLRLLFSRDGGSRIADHAMVFGEAVPDEYLADGSSRLLWELLQDAERQAREEGSRRHLS